MTREDILGIFAEAQEEQLDALLALHAADLAQLQQQNEELRAAEEQRLQQLAQLEALQLEQRFDAAVAGREFVHPMVRERVLAQFAEALQADPGADDGALLEQLTEGKGCFVQRCRLNMGDIGPVENVDVDKLTDAEYYAAFRMKGVH